MSEPKVIIGLCNPKTPENVGSVLRAAGNYGVDAVRYSGQRYPRALARNPDIPRTRRQVGEGVPLAGVEDLLADLPEAMQVVCVELALGATPLPEFDHPEQAIYLFGPEDGTLDQSYIDRADAVVYVPTEGCMNLAATVNVLLYDRLHKSYRPQDDNQRIRRSRDRNNNVKVRGRHKRKNL